MSRTAIVCTGARRGALGFAIALSTIAGCAAPAASTRTTATQGGEAAPVDSVFECRVDRVTAEEQVLDESSESELDATQSPASPSATNDATLSPAPETRAEQPDLGGFYATQSAGLGALGCALDASDCASARQLGDEICRLAERVCDVDERDPRCDEARNRCVRARARIDAGCGVDAARP